MGKIVVVGSINVDLVVTTDKRPIAGETVTGNNFFIAPGGKGANQAVAAARLGAEVEMIGCVGNDSNGEVIINNLIKENVSVKHVKRVNTKPTGTAHIILSGGDNSIIIVEGANKSLTTSYMDELKSVIKEALVVLLQLEIPIETVEYTVKLCSQYNVPVILNPAPVKKLSKDLISKVTYITPNEHECKQIFSSNQTVEELLNIYPNKLIVTEGEKGVRFSNGNEIVKIPSIEVKVTDTTGAGDTFNGALAYGLSHEMTLDEAIRFANTAAGLSVGKLGAQGGMPTLEQVKCKMI